MKAAANTKVKVRIENKEILVAVKDSLHKHRRDLRTRVQGMAKHLVM